MLLKAVLFDVDGNVVDSNDCHAHAWADVFREFGHEIAFAEVRAQIGKGADQLMPVFLGPEEVERRGEEIAHRRGEIFREIYLPRVKAFPRALDLVRKVDAAGIRVALASASISEYIPHRPGQRPCDLCQPFNTALILAASASRSNGLVITSALSGRATWA